MPKVSHSDGNKVVTSNDGSKSETYDSSGKCIDIQHNDTSTGKSHSHEVGHGLFGPFAGTKK